MLVYDLLQMSFTLILLIKDLSIFSLQSMERDPSLCCSSIVKGQSYSYTEISTGGVCYSCLTARDEFLYCYTKSSCAGDVVVSTYIIYI